MTEKLEFLLEEAISRIESLLIVFKELDTTIRELGTTISAQKIVKLPKREPKEDMADTQLDEVPTANIETKLNDVFGSGISEYLEVQDGKVQIIEFIKDVDKWKSINTILRGMDYKYHKVEQGLGFWRYEKHEV